MDDPREITERKVDGITFRGPREAVEHIETIEFGPITAEQQEEINRRLAEPGVLRVPADATIQPGPVDEEFAEQLAEYMTTGEGRAPDVVVDWGDGTVVRRTNDEGTAWIKE